MTVVVPPFPHHFYLSSGAGEVVIHRQALEEDLKGLVRLSHHVKHHGLPAESLGTGRVRSEESIMRVWNVEELRVYSLYQRKICF